jgi:hypothetical protein
MGPVASSGESWQPVRQPSATCAVTPFPQEAATSQGGPCTGCQALTSKVYELEALVLRLLRQHPATQEPEPEPEPGPGPGPMGTSQQERDARTWEAALRVREAAEAGLLHTSDRSTATSTSSGTSSGGDDGDDGDGDGCDGGGNGSDGDHSTGGAGVGDAGVGDAGVGDAGVGDAGAGDASGRVSGSGSRSRRRTSGLSSAVDQELSALVAVQAQSFASLAEDISRLRGLVMDNAAVVQRLEAQVAAHAPRSGLPVASAWPGVASASPSSSLLVQPDSLHGVGTGVGGAGGGGVGVGAGASVGGGAPATSSQSPSIATRAYSCLCALSDRVLLGSDLCLCLAWLALLSMSCLVALLSTLCVALPGCACF